MRVLLLGFGEAGQAFAEGWRGSGNAVELSTYDIKLENPDASDSIANAAAQLNVSLTRPGATEFAEADHVISLVTADEALTAAQTAAALLRTGQTYWDLNSVAPSTKLRAEACVTSSGAAYLDVGVLSPVHPQLHRTPLAIAGRASRDAREAILHLRLNADVISTRTGDAAALKLLRSIVIKGVEALVVECNQACGTSEMRERVFASLGHSLPGIDWSKRRDHVLERVGRHGPRRAAEMREAARMLEEIGIDPLMTAATVERLATQAGRTDDKISF